MYTYLRGVHSDVNFKNLYRTHLQYILIEAHTVAIKWKWFYNSFTLTSFALQFIFLIRFLFSFSDYVKPITRSCHLKMEFRIVATIIFITTCLVQNVASAPRPQSLDPQVDADLLSSIAEIQKKFSETKANVDSVQPSTTSENRRIDENVQGDDLTLSESQNSVTSEKNRQTKAFPVPLGESKLKAEGSYRRDKMLGGYYGYYPQALGAIPNPYFQMPEYFDDYSSAMDGMDAEEILGRGAGRRRPQTGMSGYQQNSPIYYIRLPPTPYMFVPGLGYISQPPTIQPMNQIAPMSSHHMNPHPMTQMNPMSQYGAPTMSPMDMNPFINVPVNFLANGKPTNIYQWAGAPQYQQPQYQQPQYQSHHFQQQFGQNPYNPMGYPQQRPQRPPPQFRPKPSLQPDSKITHLKGQYLFNGRPEQIYVLPNTPYHNSINPYPIHSYY